MKNIITVFLFLICGNAWSIIIRIKVANPVPVSQALSMPNYSVIQKENTEFLALDGEIIPGQEDGEALFAEIYVINDGVVIAAATGDLDCLSLATYYRGKFHKISYQFKEIIDIAQLTDDTIVALVLNQKGKYQIIHSDLKDLSIYQDQYDVIDPKIYVGYNANAFFKVKSTNISNYVFVEYNGNVFKTFGANNFTLERITPNLNGGAIISLSRRWNEYELAFYNNGTNVFYKKVFAYVGQVFEVKKNTFFVYAENTEGSKSLLLSKNDTIEEIPVTGLVKDIALLNNDKDFMFLQKNDRKQTSLNICVNKKIYNLSLELNYDEVLELDEKITISGKNKFMVKTSKGRNLEIGVSDLKEEGVRYMELSKSCSSEKRPISDQNVPNGVVGPEIVGCVIN